MYVIYRSKLIIYANKIQFSPTFLFYIRNESYHNESDERIYVVCCIIGTYNTPLITRVKEDIYPIFCCYLRF